jgi:hypothetical protein
LAASHAFAWNRQQPGSTTLPTRIVARIQIFEAERSDRRDLRDVLAGFRPMKMWCISWKDDDAPRRISVHLIAIEMVAKPDVEDADMTVQMRSSGCLWGMIFTPAGTLTRTM